MYIFITVNRLVLLLLLLPSFANAKEGVDTLLITKSYLTNGAATFHGIDDNWFFQPGDSAIMAGTNFDDSHWEQMNTNIRYSSPAQKPIDTFSSIGWFRFHFIADSAVVGLPLALWFTHYGASEVYLDGVLIQKYGKINGKDATTYYDPQDVPLVFSVMRAGPHVIAVRYANYRARHFYEAYRRNFAGFKVMLSEAKYVGYKQHFLMSWVMTCGLLFGLLLAFGIAHLFIFFYHRTSAANLYFSIYCFCLSSIFLFFVLNRISTDPDMAIRTFIGTLIAGSFGCFSFSGLTNSLFSAGKKRFRIIAVICLVNPLIWKLSAITGGVIYLALGFTVFLEATILTVRAIFRKMKGARIIGIGILFFTIFFFSSVIFFSFHGDINDSTEGGKIYLLLAGAAILSIPLFMSLYLAWDYAFVNRNLKKQLAEVEKLSAHALEQEHEKKRILEGQKDKLEQEVASRTAELTDQKKKSDDLLLNILPAEVADELKEKGSSDARYFDHVTVLFTDFVDFTKASERMTPQELINELHCCFKAFDEIVSGYHIEKIKTIGDAYLAVCGLPEKADDHAIRMADAATDIVAFMSARKKELGNKTFDIRIGLHSGSVVAGIVGVKKFAYDIWGDTVNTAARMEQNSEAGKINISQTTFDLVKDTFQCTYRGGIQAKNKGELIMYFLGSRKTA